VSPKNSSPVFLLALSLLLGGVPAPSNAQSTAVEPSQPEAVAPSESEPYILYQLRAGEDPTRVARMFQVPVEDLLSLNQVSDPRRLGVGATLKIPDPRAAELGRTREQRDSLNRQLADAERNLADLEGRIHALESRAAELSEANRSLTDRLTLYQVWRGAFLVSALAVIVLAAATFLTAVRTRDAERRRNLAARELEAMQAAVQRYRQLGAQLELKYQALFHKDGVPSIATARAQALRKVYEEDRERLDSIVAQAKREIERAWAELPPDKRARRGKAA
jgi:hypothetical protein